MSHNRAPFLYKTSILISLLNMSIKLLLNIYLSMPVMENLLLPSCGSLICFSFHSLGMCFLILNKILFHRLSSKPCSRTEKNLFHLTQENISTFADNSHFAKSSHLLFPFLVGIASEISISLSLVLVEGPYYFSFYFK